MEFYSKNGIKKTGEQSHRVDNGNFSFLYMLNDSKNTAWAYSVQTIHKTVKLLLVKLLAQTNVIDITIKRF